MDDVGVEIKPRDIGGCIKTYHSFLFSRDIFFVLIGAVVLVVFFQGKKNETARIILVSILEKKKYKQVCHYHFYSQSN